MKKLFLLVLPLFFVVSFADASWCFGDPLYETNEAAIVVQWVNVRTVPCMMGSEVIRVAKTNEKVRILTKDEARWYKVVLSDGSIGWIAQQFLKTTNDRSNVPGYPSNHISKSYCDTTNPNKCPASHVVPWVMPTWTYNNTVNYTSAPVNTPAPKPTTTASSLEKYKPMLDALSVKLTEKVEEKYSKVSDQIKKLEQIVMMIDLMIAKTPQHAAIFGYLKGQVSEVLTVKRLNDLLNF